MAQHPGRAALAQTARQSILGAQASEGVYVCDLRQAVLVMDSEAGQVLPSQLSRNGDSAAYGQATLVRIRSITEAGEAEVYCLTTPATGAFEVAGGVVVSNCDALRYWAVGRFLCEPRLRRMDPALSRMQSPGWRTAS